MKRKHHWYTFLCLAPVVLFIPSIKLFNVSARGRVCDRIWKWPVQSSASLQCSSSVFICRVSHRLCPCSPVCISTDRLFVHLELSAPTEYKRTHQKTLWGCFSSLKLGFSSQPSWAEVHSATQYEQRGAYSCSTSSILETVRCRNWILYLEPTTRGWTHFCRLCEPEPGIQMQTVWLVNGQSVKITFLDKGTFVRFCLWQERADTTEGILCLALCASLVPSAEHF